MGMRKKNINQLCTELTVIKDEFLLFTMILRLRIVVKLFCNFFYVSEGKVLQYMYLSCKMYFFRSNK